MKIVTQNNTINSLDLAFSCMDNSIRIFDVSDTPSQIQNISLETFDSWSIDFGLNIKLLYTCGDNGNVTAIDYETGDVEHEVRLSDKFHMPIKGKWV